MSSDPASPPRGFGLATATFVVVSSMVGTGVLTTSGYTVFFTQSNQLMLWLWFAGGVLALCGALTIAELSAALPRTGGDYVFLHEAFGPVPAFLSGWVSFLVGFGGPIAVSGAAFAKYLLDPIGLPDSQSFWLEKILATAAVLAFAIIHACGHRSGGVAQVASTCFKLVALGTLALVGLFAGWKRWPNLMDMPNASAIPWTAALSSLVYVSYAYTGWNGAGYIAGETRDATRNVPRAIFLGTGLVLVLYLALNVFYGLALSAQDIQSIVHGSSGSADVDRVAPIAWVASSALLGSRASGILSTIVGVTLLASVSAYVLTGPRVLMAMAHTGQFPAFAGRVSPRTGAPVVAIWVQVAWALALLWFAPFEQTLSYSGVGLALISMLTVATIFPLRKRWGTSDRPFLMPAYPLVPIIFLVGSALLTGAAFLAKPLESGLAVASILCGIPIYYIWRWLQRR